MSVGDPPDAMLSTAEMTIRSDTTPSSIAVKATSRDNEFLYIIPKVELWPLPGSLGETTEFNLYEASWRVFSADPNSVKAKSAIWLQDHIGSSIFNIGSEVPEDHVVRKAVNDACSRAKSSMNSLNCADALKVLADEVERSVAPYRSTSVPHGQSDHSHDSVRTITVLKGHSSVCKNFRPNGGSASNTDKGGFWDPPSKRQFEDWDV
ncbi:uncharacterized protein I303_105699 [Kwoniella dejecticola CBS 10117]|uniref:Uncharacterized protein n=1 Tax=Kwoniella dejecticola CBS 10117 TaxID=1296121 RepID=A0A1A6A052_9TREE|nr:uncharacterized protein I303_05720 [Kwoniella dejecticola CBS 10117]OBR83442.1 hypothetical protein I303_05720 [Kwoniella dejecticola CBS 10117]